MASVSRAFVHIGPLKTGTTFIQQVLWQNRETLLRNGVVLPRETFGEHVRSVLQLMNRRMHSDTGADDAGQWQVLVDEVTDADAETAVLSMEFLCVAQAAAVRRLVRTLAPAEVHVVYTARDYTKLIPAAWQTTLRNKHVPSWSDYVSSIRDTASQLQTEPEPEPARKWGRDPRIRGSWGSRFWRQQDPRQVLAPYLQHIPAERVHVVTLPPSGSPPTLLWERFCAATGLDPAEYDTTVRRANVSLGGVECEVLRRVNAQVSGRIPGDVYGDLVKFFVAREVLELREQSFPLVLPDAERDWVAARTADAVEYFSGAGVQVHGDLADLSSAGPARPGTRSPDDVSDAEVLPVVEDTLGAVLQELARRQGLRAYKGPRSYEQPMPAPHELALTGDPPGPGTRSEPKARKAGFVDPASVVALKEMGRLLQRAQRRALRQHQSAQVASGQQASQAGPGPSADDVSEDAAQRPKTGPARPRAAARKPAERRARREAAAKKAAARQKVAKRRKARSALRRVARRVAGR